MRRTAFGPCPAAYADAEGVVRGGVGSTVKSLTAHGTEQIGPKESEQEALGQGGRSGVGHEDNSPREKLIPPVKVESSSGLGAVMGELLPDLHLRVDYQVEIRVGRPGSSSELETELIAQSVSLSGEKLQSLFRRCRVELRLVRDPQVAEEVEGWSGSISGVGDRRYSGFRKSEAL